jgi:hypothetical protein
LERSVWRHLASSGKDKQRQASITDGMAHGITEICEIKYLKYQ